MGDKVQLDRLTPAHDGYVATRHGGVLTAGVTTLALEPGFYLFRTLCDANLRVVRGGVDATTPARIGKDPPPPPPLVATGANGPPALPGDRGDERPGEVPTLTVASSQTIANTETR